MRNASDRISDSIQTIRGKLENKMNKTTGPIKKNHFQERVEYIIDDIIDDMVWLSITAPIFTNTAPEYK